MVHKSVDLNLHRLLSSIADNESYAFSVFYDIYYKEVFKVAYYFVRDKQACAEVVSNVFVSIWQARKNMREIDKIEAYLYVVTKNESHRFLKTRAKSQTVSIDDIKVSIPSPCDQPDNHIIYQQIEQQLLHIINELPEKCRIIFMMNREEGLSTKDIATKLSISESTVRVQMKIAIDKISTSIKEMHPDIPFVTLFILIADLRHIF